MSFVLEKVPGVLHSCELHGKRAKRTGSDGKPPSREKRVSLSLDLTDGRYTRILDECWPGYDLLAKAMSAVDAPAQDLVSRRKMADVSIKVWAVDGKTPVFDIPVARSLGRPTLRIGQSAAKVHLSIRVVGPIASDSLKPIDDHCEADVFVDVAVAQADIEDFIDGSRDDGSDFSSTAVAPRKAKPRRGAEKTTLEVASDLM